MVSAESMESVGQLQGGNRGYLFTCVLEKVTVLSLASYFLSLITLYRLSKLCSGGTENVRAVCANRGRTEG